MTDPNIDTELDAEGVQLARIDMPGRAMNVFSRPMKDSLERLITRAETDPAVSAVVLTSGKSAFLAGADLEMIQMFTERGRSGNTEELNTLFGRLGRLFRRLERAPKPFVAAINGLALGGGLEVSLACHARVVADDPAILLGLPEIKLGLLPGAGGTQRLPRLIGTRKGLEMLLSGEPVAPAEALQLGLVDEVVPREHLIEVARRRALSIALPAARWDQDGASFQSAPFDFSHPESAFAAIAAAVGITDYQLRYYPAYRAIMRCVVGGWNLAMTAASEHEMRVFVELMRDPVAGNMVRTLFLNRQKAAKLRLLASNSPLATGDGALLPRVQQAHSRVRSLECDEEERLLALALAALRSWSEGRVEHPEMADVAVVSAGLYPSYTGGPFNYARQRGLDDLRRRAQAALAKNAEVFELPAGVDRFFQAAA